MSEAHLTKCPHCGAAFKVLEQHLQAAKGKVRCGACMQVFVALDNLVENGAKPTEKPVPKPEPEPVSSIEKMTAEKPLTSADIDDLSGLTKEESFSATEDDTDIIFQDNPEEDAQDRSYSGKDSFMDELSTSFLEMDTKDSSAAAHFGNTLIDEETGVKNTDESWAEQMLEDIESSPTRKASPKEEAIDESELSDDFAHLDDEPSSEPHSISSPSSPDSSPSMQEQDYGDDSVYSDPSYADQTIIDEPESKYSSGYHDLKSTPVSVSDHDDRSVLKTLFWTIVNVILLVTLLGQLAWYHADKLARYEHLRPIYQRACTLIGCELPDLIDIKKIRSQNLVVRSHPTINKALIIDAIIINQASFEQPFPNIALYFSELNNKVIAQRLFEPSEYLAGDALTLKMMPSQTPIHISLEIMDPGKEAVNYSVGFFSHQDSAPSSAPTQDSEASSH